MAAAMEAAATRSLHDMRFILRADYLGIYYVCLAAEMKGGSPSDGEDIAFVALRRDVKSGVHVP